ncbi:vesicle transport protein SEC20 isoform X1 [Thalassophryne amazonica]|uniref:vesicle transport protein SEC20 isoform X1 n=1 Tax=Thalassophryne amazonica TaxID=390379 RepID=UPI001470E201|nr:vesicle transport protein SEC20 isoform X1 [Thalassophryne amazonica]
MAASVNVHVRICGQEIVKYDLEIKALVQDIRDCTGPHSELTQLNSQVKQAFNKLRLRIQVRPQSHVHIALCFVTFDTFLAESWNDGTRCWTLCCCQDLEQMAREQDRDSDMQSILAETERQRRQMLSNQTAWRKANLACKLAIDNMEKDELLRGGESLNARHRKATKESLVETSSNITKNLMSVSRLMAEQVKQSEDTISTLATSSRTVQETNEEFKAITGTIHLGRKLILKYNRRELTDKLLIFLALALFLSTVLYILKKRLVPFL